MKSVQGVVIVGMILIAAGCAPSDEVYITARVLNLRDQPTTKSRVVDRLTRGEALQVVERSDPWVRVITESDKTGWVHSKYTGTMAAVQAATKVLRRSPEAIGAAQPLPSVDLRSPIGIGRSIEEMTKGLPGELTIESSPALEGEDRYVGSIEGQTLNFWGDSEALTKAGLMVYVVGVDEESLSRNADIAVRFVRNAVPRWKRDQKWMASRLKSLTSRNEGSGGFDADGLTVRFDFVRPLGAVRILIEPEQVAG